MFILAACGGNDDTEEQIAGPTVEISDDEKVPEDDVVAVVNGEEIYGSTYNLVYSQLKLYEGQFSEEVDLDKVKEATMDSIIDRQLVFQDAKELGIEVEDETIDEEFEYMKETNEETLQTLLDQFQLTETAFKEQLKFEWTMNEYILETIDVSVEDEEVEEQYEQLKEENEDIPEFDEIKDQMKRQLLQIKTNEAFEKKIAEIREESTIEELL